jgi:hypothetical protein
MSGRMAAGLPKSIGEAARMAFGECTCDTNGMATKRLTRSSFWKLFSELGFLAVSTQVLKRIRQRMSERPMTDIVLDFFVAQAEHGRAPIHGPNLGSVKSTAY